VSQDKISPLSTISLVIRFHLGLWAAVEVMRNRCAQALRIVGCGRMMTRARGHLPFVREESMSTRSKMSECKSEMDAARTLFDQVCAAAAAEAATARITSMSVPGRSFCVRIAAGSPSGLGKWLLREGCARRGHGSRGLVVPIDGRYDSPSRSRWAFAQGMAEALRAQGIRAYADRL